MAAEVVGDALKDVAQAGELANAAVGRARVQAGGGWGMGGFGELSENWKGAENWQWSNAVGQFETCSDSEQGKGRRRRPPY